MRGVASHLSQGELALRLGTTQSAMSLYESGARPVHIECLLDICESAQPSPPDMHSSSWESSRGLSTDATPMARFRWLLRLGYWQSPRRAACQAHRIISGGLLVVTCNLVEGCPNEPGVGDVEASGMPVQPSR
jgi:hypothetical protein